MEATSIRKDERIAALETEVEELNEELDTTKVRACFNPSTCHPHKC
jgi:hypothetical protein